MFGIAMKKRSDVDIQTLIKEEMMHKFDEERENFRREAKEQILKMQEENRKTYSKHRKVAKMCNVGDYVAIKRTQFGTGQKFVPDFIGAYEVTKVGRFNRYNVKRIADGDGPRVTTTAADYMKPWANEESKDEKDFSIEAIDV